MLYCYDCGHAVSRDHVCRRDVDEYRSWNQWGRGGGTATHWVRVNLCPDCAGARDEVDKKAHARKMLVAYVILGLVGVAVVLVMVIAAFSSLH
jgi:hypothetical protein